MPRRRRGLHTTSEDRPSSPDLPDGSLDPREWEVAASAAGVVSLVILGDEPWFVQARPVEVPGRGVEVEVVVRWLSSEVWEKVPAVIDGYSVEVVLEGIGDEASTIH